MFNKTKTINIHAENWDLIKCCTQFNSVDRHAEISIWSTVTLLMIEQVAMQNELWRPSEPIANGRLNFRKKAACCWTFF
jgi:hypothetical protein